MPNLDQHKKEFIKLLEDVSYNYPTHQKFYDFCQMSALTLWTPFGEYKPEELEQLKSLHKKYSKDQIIIFDKMFVILTNALEDQYHDFLGEVFMSLDMGNAYKGQFFTPYNVCKMMADISLYDIENLLSQKDFIRINEPCSGAGAMIIATVDSLKSKNINYSSKVLVIAQDVDYLACCMSYIQLSLCGVAGTVICGNTLALEVIHQWNTPVFYINDWRFKLMFEHLRADKNIKSEINIPQIPAEQIIKKYEQGEQLMFSFEAVA